MPYDFRRSNWYNENIEYAISENIIEYDVKDAGMSIIKSFKLLNRETIEWLECLDRNSRNVEVGKIQGRDKSFSESLLKKFSELRELFIRSNDLNDERIICVKKDAVFVINECQNCKFGNFEFIPKHVYSSYIRFPENNNIELFYSTGGIDVKGINEMHLRAHNLYTLDFLREYFQKIENKDKFLQRKITKHLDKYRLGELESEYYLEFNNKSSDINALYNWKNLYVRLVQILLREMG